MLAQKWRVLDSLSRKVEDFRYWVKLGPAVQWCHPWRTPLFSVICLPWSHSKSDYPQALCRAHSRLLLYSYSVRSKGSVLGPQSPETHSDWTAQFPCPPLSQSLWPGRGASDSLFLGHMLLPLIVVTWASPGRRIQGFLGKHGCWDWTRTCHWHMSLKRTFFLLHSQGERFSSVHSFSRVWLFVTPWTAASQVSVSITNSQSLLKLMSIALVMPTNHLILCRPLLLLPSIFPSIRVFSNESVLRIRWPKYWGFSFSISPSNEYSGLISFRMDWLDLLAVQGALKSLLQQHSSKASILQCSAFFIVQLSHPYTTTGKTIALTRQTNKGERR